MNENEILNWLSSNIIQVIIIISIFIQISPIKWNPITSLFNWLGKTITQDVSKQVEDMNKTIDDIQKQIYTNEKDRIRWEVLDFARSCRNGQEHTFDEFRHIIKLNDKYEDLLAKTKEKNGVFKLEMQYINELFDKYKKENKISEE